MHHLDGGDQDCARPPILLRTPTELELLRDRHSIALILIGMPGLQKRFSHSVQVLQPRRLGPPIPPLGNDELLSVLQRHWRSLGKTLDPEDFTDVQAIAAIARITCGNFRLLERLFPQIERVLKIAEHRHLAAGAKGAAGLVDLRADCGLSRR